MFKLLLFSLVDILWTNIKVQLSANNIFKFSSLKTCQQSFEPRARVAFLHISKQLLSFIFHISEYRFHNNDKWYISIRKYFSQICVVEHNFDQQIKLATMKTSLSSYRTLYLIVQFFNVFIRFFLRPPSIRDIS